MTWQVLARNADRAIVGVLSGWSLSLTLRLNEVGSWRLNVPRDLVPTGWPTAGDGIIVLRDNRVVASGNLDDDSYAWAADPNDATGGAGRYTLQGDTDLGRLAYRVTYPTPSTAWGAGQAAYWRYPFDGTTSNAEDVLRVTVNYQAGSLALGDRRVPGLTLAAAKGIGGQVRISERFTMLLDALRTVARAGGGLVFDVTDNLGGGLVFDVREPVDRTTSARFAVDLGNVERLTAQRVSPSITVALVAAQGEKELRELTEIADPTADAAWGRREGFLDQRQVDDGATPAERAAEYAKAAADAFGSGAEQSSIAAEILDTAAVRWGRDYDLGDRVSVVVPWGTVTELVRAVDVTVTETGVERVASIIGHADTIVANPLNKTVRQLLKRISQLERSL